MSREEPGSTAGSGGIYPDVRGAFMLTLLATLSAALVGVLLIELGTLAAVGVGQAVGMGGIATMAARRVPEPQAERIGLRGFELRALVPVLCLVPLVLVVSEIDNIATAWIGIGDSRVGADAIAGLEGPAEVAGTDEAGELDEMMGPLIDPGDAWSLLQGFVVLAGIAPVVEEFLFRGVLQQGVIARLGLVRGIMVVALLWTLLRPAPFDHWLRFLATALASLGLGFALGIVRVATGSILASMLLSSLWSLIALGALALQGHVELPGLNVEGTHLPLLLLLASVLASGWGGWMLYRVAHARFLVERAAFRLDGPGAS